MCTTHQTNHLLSQDPSLGFRARPSSFWYQTALFRISPVVLNMLRNPQLVAKTAFNIQEAKLTSFRRLNAPCAVNQVSHFKLMRKSWHFTGSPLRCSASEYCTRSVYSSTSRRTHFTLAGLLQRHTMPAGMPDIYHPVHDQLWFSFSHFHYPFAGSAPCSARMVLKAPHALYLFSPYLVCSMHFPGLPRPVGTLTGLGQTNHRNDDNMTSNLSVERTRLYDINKQWKKTS